MNKHLMSYDLQKSFLLLILSGFLFCQSSGASDEYDPNKNRFPEYEPYFKKPTNSGKEETIKVKHPDAARGLLKIEKDGSYIYQSKHYPKDKAGSLKFGVLNPPKITDKTTGVTYENMYGQNPLYGAYFDFEWQFMQSYGRMGIVAGAGIATTRGQGTMVRTGEIAQAQESYNLYVVPATLLLNYRFEYSDRQWVVPFVNGGGTYFGMVENRDDGKRYFAASPAISGGGGVHISMTKWDHQGHFRLASEYNVADLWLTLEGRALKGVNEDIDFTTVYFAIGVTADFK